MKRKILLLVLTLTALLLTGCTMRTVEDMYALPKRSEEYSQLQTAIDYAMHGLDYSAPISGDHQQTVQTADLDGDGLDEYLVFASGSWESPLQVLIFKQRMDGTCDLVDIIECNGAAFEQVEYIPFDDQPGMEVVIGCQVSDQVLRSVSVYSLQEGSIQQLLLVGYSKFLTCDMDGDKNYELMVLRPSETENDPAVAVYYSSLNGQIQRSQEIALSAPSSQIRQAATGKLSDGNLAVFVTGVAADGKVPTDILVMDQGDLSNISALDLENSTLQDLYASPKDINGDGVVELPTRLQIHPVSVWRNDQDHSLLRWFALDTQGREADKVFTFHNFEQGWYLTLDDSWSDHISVVEGGDEFSFYMWSEDYSEAYALFSVFTFTGSNRSEEGNRDDRFLLYSTDAAVYAAKLEEDAAVYAITRDKITESFHLIHPDRGMQQRG